MLNGFAASQYCFDDTHLETVIHPTAPVAAAALAAASRGIDGAGLLAAIVAGDEVACRVGRALGTYLHGPLLPRNPWLADWLLAQALAHRLGEAPTLDDLTDELEREAHAVSTARARERGG